MATGWYLGTFAKKGDGLGFFRLHDMGVSENSGTPKSSILIGISIINHPFWGTTIFGNTHIEMFFLPLKLMLLYTSNSPLIEDDSATQT